MVLVTLAAVSVTSVATPPIRADDDVELSPGGIQCDHDACGFADEKPWTALAKVTGYAPGCGDSGRTRTGTRPAWGTVAVDPRYVPLYSHLEIEGFDGTVFTALDTGSGVLGYHVDVWFPSCSQARQWGSRQRAIRVLEWS